MTNALSDSQGKLSEFRDNQKQQHVTPDALVITRGLAELGSYLTSTYPIPTTADVLPVPPTLMAVSPAVGAVGAIPLPAFVDGQAAFTTPLIGPKYHGARSVVLSAPLANANPIYFSQLNTVRPLGSAAVADVGTPILPGQSFILSASDYSMIRPFYVVPVIGAAGNSHQIIVNYNY